jgi:foldase protein PrsA
MKRFGKIISLILVISLMTTVLAGCDKDKKTIVFTTGLSDTEVFAIDDSICNLNEVMTYMVNIQNTYETGFGEGIFDGAADGDLADDLKELVMSRISRVKVLNLYAKRNDIELTAADEKIISNAADAYYASLTQKEKDYLNVTRDDIYKMYEEYALAHKVYDTITEDVTPEISDDEARTVTTKHVLIKTYREDYNGNRVDYTVGTKLDAYTRAADVQSLINNGGDIDEIIAKYSEDDITGYSLRRGDLNNSYEIAAFDLGKDEVSDIIETTEGYYVIKCINNYDMSQTEENKKAIIEDMKKEAFMTEYNSFISTLTGNMNEELWESVELNHDPEITTSGFFKFYDESGI